MQSPLPAHRQDQVRSQHPLPYLFATGLKRRFMARNTQLATWCNNRLFPGNPFSLRHNILCSASARSARSCRAPHSLLSGTRGRDPASRLCGCYFRSRCVLPRGCRSSPQPARRGSRRRHGSFLTHTLVRPATYVKVRQATAAKALRAGPQRRECGAVLSTCGSTGTGGRRGQYILPPLRPTIHTSSHAQHFESALLSTQHTASSGSLSLRVRPCREQERLPRRGRVSGGV